MTEELQIARKFGELFFLPMLLSFLDLLIRTIT